MQNKTRTRRNRFMLALVVAMVVFAAEAVLTYMFFDGKIVLRLFIVGHLAITLALLLWVIIADMFRRDLKFPLLFVILILAMGVLGAGICLLTPVLYAIYSRHTTSFAEWYASLFPEYDSSDHNILYERLAMGWEDFSEKSDMIPYMDVITLGSENQKHAALEKITRHFSPEFAPVLIKALEDPSNSVRVQAATVLAKLEQGFAQTALALERNINKQPVNARNPTLILQLAKHYDHFAHAGFILDKDREQAFRKKAIMIYEHYLELVPDDKEVQFYLGCLYLRNRSIEQAYALLCPVVEEGKELTPLKLWFYLECLFRKRDFNALKQAARTYFPRLEMNDPDAFKVVEMVRLWGGGIMEPGCHPEQSEGSLSTA